jgi:hypothetical protein
MMTGRKTGLVLLGLAVAIAAGPTPAIADPIRQERVRFKPGASSATIEGRIKGAEIVDYILGARQGQSMNVSMATDNTANYFNILAPGETDVAVFNGSMAENQYEGILPATGDYKVRVYLMRSAARRNEVANYRLEMIIGAGEQGVRPDDENAASTASARAGRGDFDATGEIPCAQYAGQPMGQCPFGVARGGGGTATVVVTRPEGPTRALFFINGRFNSADTAQAEGYPAASATRESDLTVIRVGAERYEVPDAVIHGG